jgi:hypothetical protein
MHAPISLDLGEWYCLRLEPRREFIALMQVTARNIRCYLPAMVRQRRIRGRLVEVRAPLLGPYGFVLSPKASLSELWNIPGVWGVLPVGREPEPVPSGVIDNLQARELAGEFYFKPTVTDKRRHRRVLRSFKELGILQEAFAASCVPSRRRSHRDTSASLSRCLR